MARYEMNLTDTGTLPEQVMGFRVRDLLGESSGITTYRVRDDKDAGFTLKHVVIRHEESLKYLQHLKNEYEIAKQVTHPNLRKAIDLKLKKQFGFMKVVEAGLVLEPADGESLEFHKSPGDSRMLRFFYQVGLGLAELHKMGYVHADIRPSNVTINVKKRKAKLIDYGDAVKFGTVLVRPNGPPDYVSPEHVEQRPLTARSDLFCFGCLLYWGLCRRNLPELRKAATRTATHDISAWVVEPPYRVNPKMPRDLSKLIQWCLELEPSDRPSSIDDCLPVINQTLQEWERNEVAAR